MKIYRNDKDEHRVREFLGKALEKRPYQIFPLAGDASSRRYYRVVIDEDSKVLMAWEPFDSQMEFPFLSVQRLFKLCGVQVPEIHLVDASLGLFLLEDLGDLTLERKFWENRDQNLTEPFYRLALDELLKIHFATATAGIESSAFKVRFDESKLSWEMNYAREHLLEKLLGVTLTPAQDKIFRRSVQSISRELAEVNPVVCHRDYHSRNLMVKFGKVRVIDFQDARLGPPAYDLVSLLMDSYVDLDDELRGRLIQYYREGAKAVGRDFPEDEFMKQFHLQSVQRCFKASGSFSSFFNLNEDRRYLKYLTPTLHRVQAALKETSDQKELCTLFEDLGLFELSFEEL